VQKSEMRSLNATLHSFGMRRRLIMREPDTPKSKVIGCKVSPASDSSPPHKFEPTAPSADANASKSTSTTEVGMGVPSKCVTFADPPERDSAVML